MLLPGEPPWILQLDKTALDEKEQQAVRTVLDLIRGEPTLREALRRLGEEWRCATLVHGDAKLDNVLFRASARPRIWLIDWGLAGQGDPAWDVGSILQSSLVLWLNGIASRAGEPFSAAAERSAFPLALVRAFAAAFVAAYLKASQLTGTPARRFVRRAFRFAGARLVQSSFEHARTNKRFMRRHLAMVQMASRLLDSPDEAAADLLAPA